MMLIVSARADGDAALPSSWRVREGTWSVQDGRLHAAAGFSMLLHKSAVDDVVEAAADVAYVSDQPFAAAGIAFRMSDHITGYLAGYREVEKDGDWERPVVQLYRLDADGWKLLQEAKILNGRSGVMRRLKVVCRGPNLCVYDEDMTAPVIVEYDDTYATGGIGLWKDVNGEGVFDHFAVGPAGEAPAAMRRDWSDVRGAVYVRSDAVNAVQMWEDYWDHTSVLDRELEFASLYGFNMVQAYLHWIVWDRHHDEYLRRIDDFVTRAAKRGLRVNLILWDDCGHVEPSLDFAAPIPGRHNSQMMPNPSHAIRDDRDALLARKNDFERYVTRIVVHFKDDDRIAFWQLYNEPMGLREKYRDRIGDENLNLLLGWTRRWVKQTGTKIPVTAPGGGFFGTKYSDFYTYHSYSNENRILPGADGGPEHLCTETLNRPNCTLIDCLDKIAGKNNGFVVWELMIGRDNCRFPWGNPDGLAEPAKPFHGVIYPDGHPWSVDEIKALLGDERFAKLQQRLFTVEYYNGKFGERKKTSITPRIDFDLGDEHGYGSPDASAGLSTDHFSMRWTGTLRSPAAGQYTIHADSDGVIRVWIDDALIVDGSGEGPVKLTANQSHTIKVEYVHDTGAARCHLSWSGPGFDRRVLEPGPMN